MSIWNYNNPPAARGFSAFFTRSKWVFSFAKPLYFDNALLYYIIIDVGTRHNTVINSDDQININTSSYFPQYVESSSTRRFILWFSACTRYNISTTIKKHHLPTGKFLMNIVCLVLWI